MRRLHLMATSWIALLAYACAGAQSYPPAWSAAASYAVGDQVQLNGNVLRAVRAVSPGSFKYSYWELWDVRANTTILVGAGGQFPTLASAWNYALNCRIAQGTYLHLSILSGHTESFGAPFSLDHPFGGRISVIGSSNVTFNFSTASNGFVLDSAHSLANLDNLNITGPAGGTNGKPAVLVSQNSLLAEASNLTVANFDVGLLVSMSGTIDNISGFQISQFLTGVQAVFGGTLNFAGAVTIDGKNTTGPVPGLGFYADGGGKIFVAAGSEANNCVDGFIATNGGLIYADSTSVSYLSEASGTQGYTAYYRGFIHASTCTVANAYVSFYTNQGGFINARAATTSGTGSVDFYAAGGGLVDATSNSGGSILKGGSADGSYVFTSD